MPDTYSSDDFPFTVEDWTDRDHLQVIALAQNAFIVNAAWAEAMKQYPEKHLVSRWGRAWTMRRWDEDRN